MSNHAEFDIIVVGGGMPERSGAGGCAHGQKTLLLTHNIKRLADVVQPVDRGIGKSHLVKESMRWAVRWAWRRMKRDSVRVLNSSKGPAVRATRAQADRVLYVSDPQPYREPAESAVMQQAVDDLIIEQDR